MRTITLFLLYYGCALYGLLNPLFGLLFFIHITILRPESLVWDNLVFGRLHLITGFLVLIAFLYHKPQHQREIDPGFQRLNTIIFLCFIGALLLSTLLAQASVESSLEATTGVVKTFVLCFLIAKLVDSVYRIRLYVRVVVLSFGALSFWGFVQGLGGNPRLDSLWPGGSNYIAAQLAMIAPLAFAKIFDEAESVRYRLAFFLCAVSIILCCIYTDSRGGFLGLCAGMLLLIIRIKQRVKVLAGLVLTALLAYPFVPTRYVNRISTIFEKQEEMDASAGSRPVLWKIALRIWQDHPVAGVGLENFSAVKETYAGKVRDIVTSEQMHDLIFGRKRYPHGLYPGMMAETGLLGTGLFLTLLLRNALCRFPASPLESESQRSLYLQARAGQAGLIGLAVAALFGDFQYLEMLYVQLFFVGAVRGCAESRRSVQETIVVGPQLPGHKSALQSEKIRVKLTQPVG